MDKTQIEIYFENKGIDVTFNTIGANQDLVKDYVRETQSIVDSSETKQSHHVKHLCYDTFCDIADRKKYTGFEWFDKKCKELRTTFSMRSGRPHFSPTLVIPHAQSLICDTDAGYVKNFSKFLTGIKNNIFLYLSGGLDSEFVAINLIRSGVSFTPVIFRWLSKDGTVRNEFDISYAFKFCEKNKLRPIVRDVDVESLWDNGKFADYAEKLNLISPHLTMHAYMVDIMSTEHPGKTHLLGGEIRYRSNYLDNESTYSNIVLLSKVSPGYSTYSKQTSANAGTNAGAISLSYSSGGSWTVSSSGDGAALVGSPTSGTWTTTPASAYEYRVSSVNVVSNTGGSYFPTSSTSYAGLGAVICGVNIPASAIPNDITASFDIDVRSVSNPGTVMSSSIEFILSNSN